MKLSDLSLRWRLTFWYVCLLLGVLVVFSTTIYIAVQRQLIEAEDDALQNLALLLDQAVGVDAGRPMLRDASQASKRDERFVRLYDTSWLLIFDNSAALGVVPPTAGLNAAGAGQASFDTVRVGEGHFRVLSLPVRRNDQLVGVMQIAESLDEEDAMLRHLLLILVACVPLTLLVASWGGVFLANRALVPIDQLTRTAQQISAHDLSRRLSLSQRGDELGRLGATFDSMIDRLERAFQQQRQFTADASHELRTPLTAMRGQIEVALSRERPAEAYRAVLCQVLAQIERMGRMLGSLLTLARADADALSLQREPLDVRELVLGVAEQLQPLAAERAVQLVVDAPQPITIQGDEDQLLQVLFNIVNNALTHTPGGGSVTLACRIDNGEACISVRDTGTGIAPEHLARVFDRFYRVDPARSRAAGGAGLGLAISRALVEAHGGCIDVESAPGRGTCFTVRLHAG